MQGTCTNCTPILDRSLPPSRVTKSVYPLLLLASGIGQSGARKDLAHDGKPFSWPFK